jgi:DNA processing protein
MPDSDLIDCLRLARAEGVGPVTYRRLLARFGGAAAALRALPGLARGGGRTTALAVPGAADIAAELRKIERLGGRMLMLGTPDYPALLAQLEDAPPAIAVLGDPAVLRARAVALVGGRNASVNGQRMAEDLAAALAAAGLVVVSGMARGIDAAAHAGALSAGRTVAVIAGGLDVPYPPEHADLQRRIAGGGAVVSEAPLGTTPLARHFPRRNRIIAGLSLGVVVIEAAARSGSLITARLAAEAGREVYAVPGCPLDPRARGGNDLIRQGATLVETAADVIETLPPQPGSPLLFQPAAPPDGASGFADLPPEPPLDPESPLDPSAARTQVLALLGPTPTPVDALVRRCQLSPPAVMAALLELELAGRVETLPGGRVAALSDSPA